MPKKFTKPTEEEISNYLTEKRSYESNAAILFAEKFWNYYESCGWKVGRKPMVSWVAAIRTWELNNKKYAQNNTGNFSLAGNKSLISTNGDFGRL